MLRSKAARPSASGKTESIAGRSSPPSTSRARAVRGSAPRRKYTTRDLGLGISGGSPATDTSLPPFRTTAGERSSSSPPTVSKTRSTGSSACSKRVGHVIQHFTSSEPPDVLDLSGRRRADHIGAAPACELCREVADTAGSPVDQHSLSLLQAAVVEEPLPGCESGERDGCALDMAERAR